MFTILTNNWENKFLLLSCCALQTFFFLLMISDLIGKCIGMATQMAINCGKHAFLAEIKV